MKIQQPLPQLDQPLSNEFVTAILEKHLYYTNEYVGLLELKISRLEYAMQIRMRLATLQAIKTAMGNLLMASIIIAVCCQTIGYRSTLLIIFAIWIAQPVQAAPPTTIQGLYNTLLYIRFRINYSWLSSGFGKKQYKEMESALINAIIQLQQAATPPPTTTTTQALSTMRTMNKFMTFFIHFSTKHSTKMRKKGRKSEVIQDSQNSKNKCTPPNNNEEKFPTHF
jgi:hypothetical protein